MTKLWVIIGGLILFAAGCAEYQQQVRVAAHSEQRSYYLFMQQQYNEGAVHCARVANRLAKETGTDAGRWFFKCMDNAGHGA